MASGLNGDSASAAAGPGQFPRVAAHPGRAKCQLREHPEWPVPPGWTSVAGDPERSALVRERVPEHWKTALRTIAGRLIFDDVPVLGQHPVGYADGIHHNPRRGQAVTTKPAANHDPVAFGDRPLRLVPECGGRLFTSPN